MKKKRNIIFLLLIIFCVVGVTYAYYSHSKSFNNNFEVGNFEVVIEEIFEEGVCLGNGKTEDGEYCSDSPLSKEVYVVNYEDTDAIVRINYNEFIVSSMETEYKNILSTYDPYRGDFVEKEWTDEFIDDWVFYDGWFYYRKVLPAGSDVKILNSVDLNGSGITGTYNLDFNVEAIQASQDAVSELWDKNVVINSDGTLGWDFDTIIDPI